MVAENNSDTAEKYPLHGSKKIYFLILGCIKSLFITSIVIYSFLIDKDFRRCKTYEKKITHSKF